MLRTATIHPDQAPPVLAFEDCVMSRADMTDEPPSLSAQIKLGEFITLQTDDEYHEAAVARALCGLAAPLRGRVRFQGRDWNGVSRLRSNGMRGRIGTVFGEDVWSPYRTVLDGMILPQMHHTRRPMAEIYREAADWALRFGLPGLPNGLPAAVSSGDRQRANFARAFIGRPALIVIRHQPHALPPGLMPAVIAAIWRQRELGTAVLWFTRPDPHGQDEVIPGDRRLRIGAQGTWTFHEPAQGHAPESVT